jgi:hypothetical protein
VPESTRDGDSALAFSSLPPKTGAAADAKPSLAATAAAIFALQKSPSAAASESDSQSEDTIKRALVWLGRHYEPRATSRESQHLEDLLMALALDAAHQAEFQTASGAKIAWSRALAETLINSQNADGSWSSKSAQPPNSDHMLTTASRLLTLQIISRGW